MRYEIITPPAEYPVTLAEVKDWLKITLTNEDSLISNIIIPTATKLCEDYKNQNFISRQYKVYIDEIQCTATEPAKFIQLIINPVISVENIKQSVSAVFEDIEFELKNDGFGRILLWGDLNYDSDLAYPITSEFTAGYGDASAVPKNIKMAVLQMAAYLYSNRGDCPDENIPNSIKNILGAPNRLIFSVF